jgi:hypothetical protein
VVLLATLLAVLPLTPAGSARVLALRPPAEVDPLGQQAEVERSFRDNLRLELWGRAALVDGDGPLQGGSADARVFEATERLGDAVVAFWLERTDERVQALYVVGRRRGRAVVEVFSLPPSSGDAAEDGRVLALKVSEAIDALLFEPPPPRRNVWLDTPQPTAPPGEPWLVFAGGIGFRDATVSHSPAQGLLAMSVAHRGRLPWPGTVLELAAEGEIGSGRRANRMVGRVDTSEGGLGAAARVLRSFGPILAGGYTSLGMTTVAAEAESPAGGRGSDRLWIPTAALGADVRVPMSPRLALRLTGELGTSFTRHQLAINDQTVLDLGRFHVSGGISLVFLAR